MVEYEVEWEDKWKEGWNSGSYQVTDKKLETCRQRKFSKFENSLGLSEDDWEAYLLMSNAWKLPVWGTSISTNDKGEETASIVWNTLCVEDDDLQTSVVSGARHVVEHSHPEDQVVGSEAHQKQQIDDAGEAGQNYHIVVGGEADQNPEAGGGGEVGQNHQVVDHVFDGEAGQNHQVADEGEGYQLPHGTEEQRESTGSEKGESVSFGLSCELCGAVGIKDAFNLSRHVVRMHSGSFKCSICGIEFSGRHSLNLHTPACYHYCPVVGCPFKEKRKQRMEGHLRMHSRFDF